MPQSIYEGLTYIGETIGSYTGDFDSATYTGVVPVEDPTTFVPTNGQPEVVLSTATDTVWLIDEEAVAIPYYVDSGLPPADAVLNWPKIPVKNWVDGHWVQLNADIGPVDFSISNVAYDRALLTIYDHLNFDLLDYELVISGGLSATIGLADDTEKFWITGLAANTQYTATLRGRLRYGSETPGAEDDWTPSASETFTTPTNPTPLAVNDLTSPARTNRWIDLKWTAPAGTTATSYKVYQGYYGGSTRHVKTVAGTTTRISNLVDDRKYRYFVRGVNASGQEGPWSNELKWATGHGEIKRQGSDSFIVGPQEWGSYRPDIQWRWARPDGIRSRNPHIYQGYWPGNNWWGAANPSQNLEAGRTRRYWGTITYDDDRARRSLDRKHGANVGKNINVSKLRIKKLYRHRTPGIVSAVNMIWHHTRANPFDSGQPPIYGSYDGRNMQAGTFITGYPLPAKWGKFLVRGENDKGTKVNGLLLHRADNQTNGYGAAGYGAWSGHRLNDPYYSGDWRESDLRLVMEGSWSFTVQAYKGPYRW